MNDERRKEALSALVGIDRGVSDGSISAVFIGCIGRDGDPSSSLWFVDDDEIAVKALAIAQRLVTDLSERLRGKIPE